MGSPHPRLEQRRPDARVRRGVACAVAALLALGADDAPHAPHAPHAPQEAERRIELAASALERSPEEARAAAADLFALIDELAPRVEPAGAGAAPSELRAFVRAHLLLAELGPPEFDTLAGLERVTPIVEELADGELYLQYALEAGNAATPAAADRARGLILRALPKLNQPGAGRFRVYTQLAQLDLLAGRFDGATRWIDGADADLQSIDRSWPYRDFLECELAGRKFELFMALGVPDRALAFLRRETELASRLDVPLFELSALIHACDHPLGTMRFGLAERAARKALEHELCSTRSPERTMIELRLAAALWELALNDASKAEEAEALLRGILADEHAGDEDRLIAELALAELLSSTGRTESGARHLAAIRESRAGIASFEHAPTIAALACREARQLGLGRAVRSQRRDELQLAFERLLDSWGSTPLRPGGVGFLAYGRRRLALSELMVETIELDEGEGARRALELLFRAQSYGSIRRASGRAPGSLADARARLTRDGAGVLTYLPGRLRCHLFAFDAEHLQHVELDSPREIELLRRQYVSLLGTPSEPLSEDQALLGATAARLASMLLPDAANARWFEWSAITVVGADFFGYLPFEFLPTPGGAALGERAALAYVPSLPLVNVLHARADAVRRPHSIELIALAAPRIGTRARAAWPELRPIPFGRSQEKALRAEFSDEQARIWSGADATGERLRTAASSSPRVLAILTHGLHDAERERSAGLLLAPTEERDGAFWCEDIDSLTAPPLVVVLACEAGRGALRRGEDGVSNMGGALLAAGAQAVVLSPKGLDYAAALELARLLPGRVHAGESPAAALRATLAELRAQERFRHPAYRLVHVVGLGHAPLR